MSRLTQAEKDDTRRRYPKFPIQPTRGVAAPLSCSWEVAEKAYSHYAALYGMDQSLERLAQRGGFGSGEMGKLYPDWQTEESVTFRLRSVVESAKHLSKAQIRMRDDWAEASGDDRKRVELWQSLHHCGAVLADALVAFREQIELLDAKG